MKRSFLAALVVLGLAVLATGAWTVLPGRSYASSAPAKGDEEQGDGPFFVRLDNLLIPVIRHNRVERHVSLSVAFEVKDADLRRAVQRALPRLRDAFIADLNGYLRVVQSENNPRFLLILKRRLMEVGARVMGDGVIDAVLVQQASERDLL